MIKEKINFYSSTTTVVATIVLLLYANIQCSNTVEIESGKKASTRKNWNFEIFNKTNKTIWFSLRGKDDKSLIHQQEVESQGKIRAVINKDDELLIKIWKTKNPTTTNIFRSTPDPDIEKNLRGKGRTKFLTLDNKVLRPQTGIFFGIIKKTDSGLDNSNNIHMLGIQ